MSNDYVRYSTDLLLNCSLYIWFVW